MLPAGQHAHVSGEQVGKVPAMPSVTPWQGLPQAPGRGRVAAAGDPSHDVSAGALNGQPKPDFALSTAHKRPHLIQLKCLPLAALGVSGATADSLRALFFTSLATVTRETPVTRTMLRCELRSTSSFSTWA